MTPSPYQVAQNVGNKLGNIPVNIADRTVINEVMERASNMTDPMEVQQLVSEIVSKVSPERQKNVLAAITDRAQQMQNTQNKANLREQYQRMGYDPGLADLPEAAQISFIKADQAKSQQPGVGGKGQQKFEENRAKQIGDFVNEGIGYAADADDLEYTLDVVEQAVQGDVAGPGFEAMAKNNPYAQLITGLTPDEATLQAANKKLLEGTKGIFGPRPTEREIFLLLNQMLPSIGKSKEANLAGIKFIRQVNDMKRMKGEIINQLTNGGQEYVPNIEFLVQEQMKPYTDALREQLKGAVNQQTEATAEKKGGKQLSPSQQLIENARKRKQG